MSLELLVLGSGGPFANPHRASSGYAVLTEEQPRLLVDAGGGTFERRGRAEVPASSLGTVLRETEHGHLHAKPSEVGRMARDSRCPKLVVTHVMPELEDELDEALKLVADAYDGEIVVARDLLQVRAQ